MIKVGDHWIMVSAIEYLYPSNPGPNANTVIHLKSGNHLVLPIEISKFAVMIDDYLNGRSNG